MSYTQEDYETVKELLLNHRGKGNEISSRDINDVVELDNVGSFPQTRELVKDIVFQEGIPVVGGGNGYYVAETEEEVGEYLETLESRILSNAERKMAVKRAANNWQDELEEDDEYDIL